MKVFSPAVLDAFAASKKVRRKITLVHHRWMKRLMRHGTVSIKDYLYGAVLTDTAYLSVRAIGCSLERLSPPGDFIKRQAKPEMTRRISVVRDEEGFDEAPILADSVAMSRKVHVMILEVHERWERRIKRRYGGYNPPPMKPDIYVETAQRLLFAIGDEWGGFKRPLR